MRCTGLPFKSLLGANRDALIVGVETFNPFALFGFESMQLLAPERAEPLGTDRQGMVLGEAVAALRLTSKPSDTDSGAAHWGFGAYWAYANVVDGVQPHRSHRSRIGRGLPIGHCATAVCRQAIST